MESVPRAKDRANFEKSVLAALTPLLKGTGWNKSKTAVLRQAADYYQDVLVSVYRNANRTTAELRLKPMALDPILWDILSFPDNRKEPLSFRTWGAFTCSPLPVAEVELEDSRSAPDQVAASLVAWLHTVEAPQLHQPFSEVVLAHPNQVARGAYAITLVTSLIHEGKLSQAQSTASAYASGAAISSFNISSAGKSFHVLAQDWLSGKGSAAGA